jgi:hypothetical protein
VELWWAEALLMAAWWLLWGGLGAEALRPWGIGRSTALATLGAVWLLGWIRFDAAYPGGPLDGGLLAATALGVWLIGQARRPGTWLGWLVLALLAALIRGVAPVNPQHVTLVPWIAGEAVALGLLAAALAWEPLGAAALATAAAGLASALRLWLHPVAGVLANGDWLYTVLAAVVAWLVAAVLRMPGAVRSG